MRKLLTIILIVSVALSATACGENKSDLQNEISGLKEQRNQLVIEVQESKEELAAVNDALAQKSDELKLAEHKIAGGETKYVLTLELKQSHFTLDIGQAIKDEMNKTEFEIAVDKEVYDQQIVGGELVREFRMGSFILGGAIGDWIVTVTDKKEVPVYKTGKDIKI